MEKTVYKVTIKLTEPLLGTVACSKSIWRDYITTKLEKDLKKEGKTDDQIKEEIDQTLEAVPETDELDKGLTSFFLDPDKGYHLRDYQIRAFFKSAAKAQKEYGAMKQLRSKVVEYLFIRPSRIYLAKPKAELEVVERPLRASTPQGERVAIARSHSIPADTEIAFEVHSLHDVLPEKLIRELLSYGEYCGLGQNRGSGFGRFEVVSFA